MKTRTTLATVALLAAALTACSPEAPDPEPNAPATSSAPAVDPAQARQDCVDAVADLEPNDEGEVPSEPVPDACADLSSSDYLDAYMDGIEQSNQQGIDDLQDAIDKASQAAEDQ
ncbi:hypothetical protein [Streptomyces sp. NPDC052225]|uniref:hypothetical protein n=1 Tax=Streptomyces sp. NPDC052225 TaxID=3154949 RepID=UPI0034396416